MNAQSLNAREISLGLNPAHFTCSFFLGSQGSPDPRLRGKSHVRFVRMPPRMGSFAIAREMLWGGQDIIFYPEFNDRSGRLFRALKPVGRRKKLVANIEVSLAQLQAGPDSLVRRYLQNIREADCCVAITPFISESFRKAYGFESMMIPVGVNLGLFSSVRREVHGRPVKVLYVGSVQPRKQTHLILEIARKLRREPVEFHIVGPVIREPSYRENLLAEKERDGLSNVVFHDSMMQDELGEWMQLSDVFLLPSRLEGLPKVTLEAAATGLPCVVFDDYHTPSVVDGVTGFQVKTFDEMVEKISLLVENRELRLRMGEAAAEHAKQFDWDIVVKQWEKVFKELVRDN